MRVTYKDLMTKSYSQLLKKGAKDLQIRKVASQYYTKYGKQLLLNEKDGKTLSTALRDIKRFNKGGNLKQYSVELADTIQSTAKYNVNRMEKIAQKLGKQSYANKILNEYYRGEMSIFQLDDFMYSYTDNPANYEKGDIEIVTNVLNVELAQFKFKTYDRLADRVKAERMLKQ